MHKEVLAHMLTAATLLIAKHWKSQENVTIADWVAKLKYICLINKLTATIKYRMGKTNALQTLKWSGVVLLDPNIIREMIRLGH